LLAGLRKYNSTDFLTKFGAQKAHGPRKKPLDFGDNLDHVTLGVWLEQKIRKKQRNKERNKVFSGDHF